jgi:hypothetical protein
VVDGRLLSPSSPSSFLNPYPIQPFSGHFEPPHPAHSVPDDIQVESFRRMTLEDNRSATHFRHPIPFYPGPPTQLTPLRSQYDSYPVPEYGSYMVQHPNPYVEYPVGYGNVSGPSLYPGHPVGNLASNNCYPLQLGPGPEVHQHPGFPYDFGQRPMPQYYYPTPPNMSISPQIPQHLSVSPLIPGSSTRYMGNFDQQVCHG